MHSDWSQVKLVRAHCSFDRPQGGLDLQYTVTVVPRVTGLDEGQVRPTSLFFPHSIQVNKRYSKQLCLPSDTVGVFEEDGGILMAKKAVAAYQVNIQKV